MGRGPSCIFHLWNGWKDGWTVGPSNKGLGPAESGSGGHGPPWETDRRSSWIMDGQRRYSSLTYSASCRAFLSERGLNAVLETTGPHSRAILLPQCSRGTRLRSILPTRSATRQGRQQDIRTLKAVGTARPTTSTTLILYLRAIVQGWRGSFRLAVAWIRCPDAPRLTPPRRAPSP